MPGASPEAIARARRVRIMIFDVDGVLTDGRLWYGAQGEALKSFHTLDGHGMKMLMASGVAAAILSGRRSEAVAQRARELGIEHVMQGVEQKGLSFESFVAQIGVPGEAAGYMGDDLVDLPAMRRCGFACAPKEAPEVVRRHAHYVAQRPAGQGAAREVCEFLMQAQGTLEAALAAYLRD